jgi:hypothetical protein
VRSIASDAARLDRFNADVARGITAP